MIKLDKKKNEYRRTSNFLWNWRKVPPKL